MLITGAAGDHDIAPVHPHPHIAARYEVDGAVMAVPAAQFPRDPDPLAHGNFARELYIAVA
jgi:hypothetical protein